MPYDGFHGQVFNWENRLGAPDPTDRKYVGFLGAMKYRIALDSYRYLSTVFNTGADVDSNPLDLLHNNPDHMGNVAYFIQQCNGMASQYLNDMEDLYETFGFPHPNFASKLCE